MCPDNKLSKVITFVICTYYALRVILKMTLILFVIVGEGFHKTEILGLTKITRTYVKKNT